MICSVDDLVVFLRRFHRHWVDSPKLKNVAIPPDLPDGLRIIYRELGALVELDARNHGFRAPFDAQDSLVPLSKLKRIDGMIEFAKENQSVW
jgi:hypothetical protein